MKMAIRVNITKHQKLKLDEKNATNYQKLELYEENVIDYQKIEPREEQSTNKENEQA